MYVSKFDANTVFSTITNPDGGVHEVHELEQLPSGTYGKPRV